MSLTIEDPDVRTMEELIGEIPTKYGFKLLAVLTVAKQKHTVRLAAQNPHPALVTVTTGPEEGSVGDTTASENT